MTKKARTAIILVILAVLIALVPLFTQKGAEFGGSDDAGSEMITEITGEESEPWFTPVLETMIGGELPVEVESLFFCVPFSYTHLDVYKRQAMKRYMHI